MDGSLFAGKSTILPTYMALGKRLGVLGLDTNVLARFLLEDDPVQSRRANRMVRDCRKRLEKLYVATATTLELEWVLRGQGCNRAQVVSYFYALIEAAGISFQNESALEQALEDYLSTTVDFGECLFHAIYEWEGCTSMLTFDKRAAKQLPRCTLL
jgi:predicted nucleic-acid-binding protein